MIKSRDDVIKLLIGPSEGKPPLQPELIEILTALRDEFDSDFQDWLKQHPDLASASEPYIETLSTIAFVWFVRGLSKGAYITLNLASEDLPQEYIDLLSRYDKSVSKAS